MYTVKITYDELRVLSHIVNEQKPPISIVSISRSLGYPKVKVARILRRIGRKWWIMVAPSIERICLRKLLVISKEKPPEEIINKVVFIGKTISDKYVTTLYIPKNKDPQEYLNKFTGIKGYYTFTHTAYNKPLLEKYFTNGYIKVDLHKVILETIELIQQNKPKPPIQQQFHPCHCTPLDPLDKKIIQELADNGLQSTRTLARKLKTPIEKINKRTRYLARNNILQGYTLGYNKITDMGPQLYWIIFITKTRNQQEAQNIITKLTHTPFTGHIDYNPAENTIKLIIRIYKNNIEHAWNTTKTIGENLNTIDTIIINTKTAKIKPNNILKNTNNQKHHPKPQHQHH